MVDMKRKYSTEKQYGKKKSRIDPPDSCDPLDPIDCITLSSSSDEEWPLECSEGYESCSDVDDDEVSVIMTDIWTESLKSQIKKVPFFMRVTQGDADADIRYAADSVLASSMQLAIKTSEKLNDAIYSTFCMQFSSTKEQYLETNPLEGKLPKTTLLTLEILVDGAMFAFYRTEQRFDLSHAYPTMRRNIKMYTDIEKKKEDIKNLPSFNYIVKNRTSKALAEMSAPYTVSCSCIPDGTGCTCFKNPNCECNQVAMAMMCAQNREDPVYVSTHGNMEMYREENYYTTVGFACGQGCFCKGECGLNPFKPLDVHSLEIYRRDPVLNFGVRTMSLIPAGCIAIEMTGDIILHDDVNDRESEDYCYNVLPKCPRFNRIIRNVEKKMPGMDGLADLFKQSYQLDPKSSGNEGRFTAHGCLPNLNPMRVFQGGVSPAHVRLVFVAIRNIYPGEELTFSYGVQYIKDHCMTDCLCGTLACPRGECFPYLLTLSENELKEKIIQREANLVRWYENLNMRISIEPSSSSSEESDDE